MYRDFTIKDIYLWKFGDSTIRMYNKEFILQQSNNVLSSQGKLYK